MESLLLALFVFTHLLHLHAAEEMKHRQSCPPFTCGKLAQLLFPFNNSTSHECGLCSVSCSESQEIQFEPGGRWYHILNISQANIVRINDSMLTSLLKRRSCDVFNHLTLPNLSYVSYRINPSLQIYKCNNSLRIAPPRNFNSTTCGDFSFYYSPSNDTWPGHPPPCPVIQLPGHRAGTYRDLFTMLTAEFSVEVKVREECYNCYYQRSGQCQNGNQGNFHCSVGIEATKGKTRINWLIPFAIGAGIVIVVLVALCCYFRRIFLSNISMIFWNKKPGQCSDVERLIKEHALAPKRLRYSRIKQITNKFQDKLGEGGFGIVYRGKLENGTVVAVKVLNNRRGSGQDFINEVASISRTSHVNIVSLLGFCFEGSKRRALIYEFVPKGSLEKFIYNKSSNASDRQLGWKLLYQISLGIARGLEYLHRGCKTRIVHFDVKPHNILLDEDFCPKISDFGLAKLCPEKESILSMTGARGTPGYIAPELCCRNIGEVSHKSDVYSYGMMVLEMVGGRKNISVEVDHSSEIYFPHWIYKRLEMRTELGLQGIGNEEDNEYARKMTIVSLWCIQTDPSVRPPMSEVVDMLQGSVESLQIPPKPYLSSPPRSAKDFSTTTITKTL